eukprot:CAMPEP_0198272776 /NCGR_PEP_ID=MMETSP1447-20131203/54484_1 /TAXON_ID=420782 /ORGANISM="Chaetoceros dichaeta, Strain CCMP1751" /LENGTH=72 /DNA_ID=CAMNT_0043966141 /DNA_START=87 /DNA_END=305 /DNA_ORIENTATION=-
MTSPAPTSKFEYPYVKELLLRTDHEIKAKEWDGNLAPIHSLNENNMLLNLVKTTSSPIIFIGGRRSANNYEV